MTRPNLTIDDITIDCITSNLHLALRRETANILILGSLLCLAKKKIPHGGWRPWLKNNVSMSERSAQKCIEAAAYAMERFHEALQASVDREAP
jgi:hypothetical protein